MSLHTNRGLDQLKAMERLAELQALPFPGRSCEVLLATVPNDPDWLVPGLLARGWCIKVAAREKRGKGTLVFYLLAALETGTDTAFGPSGTTTALIYTEEPQDAVREKVELLGLSRSDVLFSHDMPNEVRTILDPDEQWAAKCALLAKWTKDRGHDLLFVDNISRAAAVNDEAGVELARRAERLAEECRAAGLTLIVDHHHRKAAGDVTDLSRGGTAMAGAFDVNIEMERKSPNPMSRTRRITAMGRLRATCWARDVKLTDDGRGYLASEASSDEDEGSVTDARRLGMLRDRDPMTADEMAELFGLDTGNGARQWITAQGRAVIECGKRGRAKLYALAGPDDGPGY